VKRYDGKSGAFKSIFVSPGSGGLEEAEGVTFGPNGNLFVVGELGGAVLEYDGTTGAFLNPFVGEGTGGLAEPTFLTFGATPVPLPPAAYSALVTAAAFAAAKLVRVRRGVR
jgi:hypothetical protein